MSKHPIAYALWAALLLALVEHAAAQPQIGTFAGKTVNLIIGFGPGGGYDLWGRIVARHIGSTGRATRRSRSQKHGRAG